MESIAVQEVWVMTMREPCNDIRCLSRYPAKVASDVYIPLERRVGILGIVL
jgi:hypothetical protein